jgi:hypothetical protein
MDIEAGAPPGEEADGPFGAEELPKDEISQDLSAE